MGDRREHPQPEASRQWAQVDVRRPRALSEDATRLGRNCLGLGWTGRFLVPSAAGDCSHRFRLGNAMQEVSLPGWDFLEGDDLEARVELEGLDLEEAALAVAGLNEVRLE